MRRLITLLVALFMAVPCLCYADDLITHTDITYLGAFTVPATGTDPASTAYGASLIGFNPTGNGGLGSIYVDGIPGRTSLHLLELSIPSLYTGSDPNSLSTSSILTAYSTDVTDGHAGDTGLNGTAPAEAANWALGGILVYDGKILLTQYGLYTTSGGSYNPFFWINLDTSSIVYDGQYGLDLAAQLSGYGLDGYPGCGDFQSGALGNIPSAYQTQLGGTVMVGSNSYHMSRVARTSWGPSIVTFDPDNLGTANSSATGTGYVLSSYATNHPTLGVWGTDDNEVFSRSDHYAAICMPANSRTVLVIGQHGSAGPGYHCDGLPLSGEGAYGFPTTDCELHGTLYDGGPYTWVYDEKYAGNHLNSAWPYSNYVWAYDVGDASGNNTTGNAVESASATHPELNNLTAVKLGLIAPYEVKPYSYWSLPTYNDVMSYNFGKSGSVGYTGGSFDDATGKLYLMGYEFNGAGGYYALPVIEVYQVDITGTGTPAPTVSTTVPTTEATYDNGTSTTLIISGISANATSGTWSNSLGGSGSVTLNTETGAWSFTATGLSVGSNVITVTLTGDGGSAQDILTVTVSSTPSSESGTTITGPMTITGPFTITR